MVGLARQLRKAEEALEGYAEAAACDRGDFMEYAALRRRLSETEKGLAKSRAAGPAPGGDRLPGVAATRRRDRGAQRTVRGHGRGASTPGHRVVADREGPRPYVLTADRHARRLSLVDFPTPVGQPDPAEGAAELQRPQRRSSAATSPRPCAPAPTASPRHRPGRRGRGPGRERAGGPRRCEELRVALRAHPCHGCPDREDHARWAERWFKLDRDARTLRRRIEQRTNTIARQFDRVCEVLTALGYLEGEGPRRASPTAGAPLMRIYNEMDLLTAESLRVGLWDGLDPSALAAVLSTLVYETRRPDDAAAPRIPGGRVKQVLAEMVSIWADLDALEREHHLDQLHEPDLGFAWAAYRWAEGDELDDVLDATDLAAGDFVRWVKQLLDLADQVADAAGDRRPARHRSRDRRATASRRRGLLLGERVALRLPDERSNLSAPALR